jgi:DinB superfamily
MVCAMAWILVPGVMVGQAPIGSAGPSGEVQASYARIKPNILKAAEKMPAESYQFKPTPEVRTFARVVNHVIEAQMHSCGAVNGAGTGGDVKMPAETAGKAEILEALKASFAACDTAYAGTTDANMAEMVTAGQGKRSRLGILWGNVSHDNEQYATLALYLRLKGLVPPSSEK